MGDLGNPYHNVTQAPLTFDVEMEGKTGHTCHIYIMADTALDAEAIAQDQFPELNLTGNTREV